MSAYSIPTPMGVTPINEAEAIIARFFDPLRKQVEAWHREVLPGRQENGIEASWHAVVCHWAGGAPVRGRMWRDVDLDVHDFTHLNLCLQSSSTTLTTVRAVVDGEDRVFIDQAPGTDSGQELERPLMGSRITRIEISFKDPARTPGVATLFWMGLFHDGRRRRMREEVSYYSGGWDDLMLPPDQVVADPEPILGLHFGGDDLEGLRRKAASPTWAPIMEQLRTEARSHLRDEPWRGVGRTINNCTVRDGRMENNTLWISWPAMRLCAFVGLLDRDADLLRMAANHALAAAHCDTWNPTFMFSMPGSGCETRAFYEYRTAINAVFAWDWAGSYLTEAGRTLLAQAVSIKGLPWCLQTLMRHPYVRGCNQGVFFSYGAIVCELALAKIWPHGGELLDAAIAALDQTVTAYYAEDGGTYEGIGYATGTLAQALAAYAVIARHKGVAIENVVPDVVSRIPNYLTTMLSTQPPYGAVIKTADGGRAGACVDPPSLGILCGLSDDPAIPALLAGLNTQPISADYRLGDELNLMFGPDRLPAPASDPPVFNILDTTGMLCSCRPTADGPVRLQLVGGPADAGHCHDDRGSFVLEAFGEEIAIDRGQMPYADPRSGIIKHAQFHNVLTPDHADGAFALQVNPCPEATVPHGTGDEREMSCRIDASAAYAGVDRWIRSVKSEQPTELRVTDEMDLEAPGTVSFHLHSLFPWEQTHEGWLTRGTKAVLLVSPEWQPVEAWGKEDFVDGLKNPVYHLALRAATAREHLLETRLRVRPA